MSDHCESDASPNVCAASKRLRKRPLLMCSPRAPIGETCVRWIRPDERRERERSRSRARVAFAAVAMLAARYGVPSW